MKKNLTIGLLLLIVLGLFGAISLFYFTGKKKFVYVFAEKIFQEYKGAKEITQKLKEEEDRQKLTLDSLYNETLKLDKEGKKAEVSKNREVYQNLYTGFMASNKKQREQYNVALWKQINQYLGEYGQEKNFDYVLGALGNGSIMYADTTLNVTDEVIQYINKKYAGN